MTENEANSGFEKPRPPRDEISARLYEKHGLGESPSLKTIEPVATELLEKLPTAFEGAELVLGRRIDSSLEKEPDVIPMITSPNISAEDKFGLLLLQLGAEEMNNSK